MMIRVDFDKPTYLRAVWASQYCHPVLSTSFRELMTRLRSQPWNLSSSTVFSTEEHRSTPMFNLKKFEGS